MPFTILVSGSNKGIGYEAVKRLSMRKPDATILLSSRSIKNGQDAIKKMKSSDPSYPFSNVTSTYGALDFLIHNSGISNLNGDGKHPDIFNVNVRGARNCLETFLPLITPGTGKITVVSSQVGAWYQHLVNPSIRQQFEDIDGVTWEKVEEWMQDWEKFAAGGESKEKWVPFEEGMVAAMYTASKGLLNPWLRMFAETHPEVKVAVVCPGYCATDLNGHRGFRTAEQGGESVIWPTLNEFESGKFYEDGKEVEYDQAIPEMFQAAAKGE